MIDYKDVSIAATGCWDAILPALGIELRKLNTNGPCPLCGGNDRAHFYERQGRIMNYCRHGCGNAGPSNEVSTPEHLLMEINHWTFPQMVEAVANYLHITPKEELSRRRELSKVRAAKLVTMPSGHAEDPKKATDMLGKCERWPNHPWLKSRNAAPYDECLVIKGKLIVDLYSPTGELTNLVALGETVNHYSAGGISYGSTARLVPAQESSGKIVLVQDYGDAWRIWWRLKGQAEVRCAISPENFAWMIGRAKNQFNIMACYEKDAIHYAEMFDDVIVIDEVYA